MASVLPRKAVSTTNAALTTRSQMTSGWTGSRRDTSSANTPPPRALLSESGMAGMGGKPSAFFWFASNRKRTLLCVSNSLVHHHRMRFSVFLSAAVASASLSEAVAAVSTAGRYTCVLSGQGACSDEGICLGNRVSPIDRNIRLEIDFERRTASLNKITGRLYIASEKPPVIRWDLSTMGDVSVFLNHQPWRTWITLMPERGFGATANFDCRHSST